MIQAIQTRYDGHHFRSRLEARWAVFFNELDIPWEYEPQGYEINGRKYLPDFWLPEQSLWFEVKGEMPDEATLDMYTEMAAQTNTVFVVALGSIKGATFGVCDPEATCARPREWTECAACGRLDITPNDWHMTPSLDLCGWAEVSDRIRDAYTAASSARFEHGQSGRG